MYTVYKHICPNGKVYIGITSLDLIDRWRVDGSGYKTQYFYRAIQKYGWDNIQHEILFEGLTREEAEQKEIELIAEYKSNNPEFGYNLDNGGKCGSRMSEVTKEKLRQINLGKHHTEESRRKMSESRTGKHLSIAHKQAIGRGNKGKKVSEESRKKMSEARKGMKMREDVKLKISEATRGKKIPALELFA